MIMHNLYTPLKVFISHFKKQILGIFPVFFAISCTTDNMHTQKTLSTIVIDCNMSPDTWVSESLPPHLHLNLMIKKSTSKEVNEKCWQKVQQRLEQEFIKQPKESIHQMQKNKIYTDIIDDSLWDHESKNEIEPPWCACDVSSATRPTLCAHKGIKSMFMSYYKNQLFDSAEEMTISESDIAVMILYGARYYVRYANYECHSCKVDETASFTDSIGNLNFIVDQNSTIDMERLCKNKKANICHSKQAHQNITHYTIHLDFKLCEVQWCTYLLEDLMSRRERKLFCKSNRPSTKTSICQQYC